MTQLVDWLNEVRSSLEDNGDTIVDNATGDGTTKRWKLSSFPVKSGSDTNDTTTGNGFTVGGVVQTITTNYSINYNTGEVNFVSAPGNGVAVVFQYTKVIWPDARLISGVNAGIREMRKDGIYQIGECYVQLAVNKYDYDLSSTTDVPAASAFTDQTIPTRYNPTTARTQIAKAQSRIHFSDFRPVGANQMYTPFDAFRRTTPTGLHIDRSPAPNDTLRLTYTAPLTPLVNLTDVSDVPDEFYMAPVWFAMSTILEQREARRGRFDAYQVTQGMNAVPPGTQAQTAADFLARYKDLVDGGMPPLRMRSRTSMRPWQTYGGR